MVVIARRTGGGSVAGAAVGVASGAVAAMTFALVPSRLLPGLGLANRRRPCKRGVRMPLSSNFYGCSTRLKMYRGTGFVTLPKPDKGARNHFGQIDRCIGRPLVPGPATGYVVLQMASA